MTTNLRRITISLPPGVDETVREFAKSEGISQSKVITNILSEFAPTMRNLMEIQKHLRAKRTEEAKRVMQHTFGDMMAGLLQEHMAKKGEKK